MTLFDAGALIVPLIGEEFIAFITYPLGYLFRFLVACIDKEI
jgi:hypothetical protein